MALFVALHRRISLLLRGCETRDSVLRRNDGVGAVGTEIWAVLFEAREDALLDVIVAKSAESAAAHVRDSVLDLLRATWRYLCSAQTKTMQRRIRVRAQP